MVVVGRHVGSLLPGAGCLALCGHRYRARTFCRARYVAQRLLKFLSASPTGISNPSRTVVLDRSVQRWLSTRKPKPWPWPPCLRHVYTYVYTHVYAHVCRHVQCGGRYHRRTSCRARMCGTSTVYPRCSSSSTSFLSSPPRSRCEAALRALCFVARRRIVFAEDGPLATFFYTLILAASNEIDGSCLPLRHTQNIHACTVRLHTGRIGSRRHLAGGVP